MQKYCCLLPYVVKGVGEAAHIEQLVVHNFDSPHHHIVDSQALLRIAATIDRGGIPNSVERTWTGPAVFYCLSKIYKQMYGPVAIVSNT